MKIRIVFLTSQVFDFDESLDYKPDLIISKFFDVFKFDEGNHNEVISFMDKQKEKLSGIKTINSFDIISKLTDRQHEMEFCQEIIDKIRKEYKEIEAFIPEYQIIKSFEEFNDCVINQFPTIIKSLNSHGKNSKLHECIFLMNKFDSITKQIKFPIICQKFLNHNGVIVKIYVMGKFSFVTQIESIENSNEIHQSFSFQTKKNSKKISFDIPDEEKNKLERFSQLFRHYSKLDVFNLDLLITRKIGENIKEIALIDLNIFPTCKKVPNYHERLFDLVRDHVSK